MSRPPQPAVGAISFEVLAEIAVGTTARIDLCRVVAGQQAGQLIAVKRLLAHIAEDQAMNTMFLDEVWMTAALKHPNVVEVAGWGQDAEGAYLAVELVEGVSLARLMKTVFDTGEIFSERMVVYIMSRVCSGLAAAHSLHSAQGEHLNLVHRDLTPANVLLGFNGDVKIADFGLAKAKQRITRTLTGLLKGQPQYMSPEQAKGGMELDGRSDLFSLGVAMFELFAGRRPWSATSELEMVHVAATEPPVDLREYRPKIDRELVGIVMRCLEKDPGERFQSAFDVQARLDVWLNAHGYMQGTDEALARFVRRNGMRQMRWFERAVSGELAPMPDSMRPPRPIPPRVPSYSNVSNAPMSRRPTGSGSSGSPRARVRPRRVIDSETTDVTDVEAKVAALHDGNAPAEIDWGEEVPTLVQKDAADLPRLRPRGPPPKQAFDPNAITDDDSQRTTAVKRPVRPVSEIVRARAPDGPRHPPPPHRAAIARVQVEDPISDDMESEEVPTLPLKRGIHRPPGQVVGPSPGVPAPPIQVPPPPPLAPVPQAPQPRRDGATPSGVRVADVLPGSDALPSPARRPPPGGPTEEYLLAEADRLAVEAVRLGEEAKNAAAVAVRKTSMAKVAGDAAAIAAEAVRLAGAAGLAVAVHRLQEALALEASLRAGEAAPLSLPRPSLSTPPPPPHSSAPTNASHLIPDAMHLTPFDSTGPLRAIPEALPMVSGEYNRSSTFDPRMFRSQLTPTMLGVPRAVALMVFVVAVVLAALVFWWLF